MLEISNGYRPEVIFHKLTTTMKKYLYYFSIFTVLNLWQVFADDIETKEWGAVTNDSQMSIRLKDEKREIKIDQSLVLSIRIRNLATNDAFFFYEATEENTNLTTGISYNVISPSGKEILPTVKAYGGSSGGFITVHPNQIKEFEFNLSQIYKLDEVGGYKIIAKKTVWHDQNKQYEVISNPLNVIVSN
jgi:hypothetical protein